MRTDLVHQCFRFYPDIEPLRLEAQARSQVVCWGGGGGVHSRLLVDSTSGVARIIHVCMVGPTLRDVGFV